MGGYAGPKKDNNFYDCDSNNTGCFRAEGRWLRYVPNRSLATTGRRTSVLSRTVLTGSMRILRCTSSTHVCAIQKVTNGAPQGPTMCRRRPPRIVPISHYFMRRKQSLLCRARAKLLCNYPRRVFEGIRREAGGRDKSCTVIIFEFGSVPSARTESADL